jgi:hypothetical protein
MPLQSAPVGIPERFSIEDSGGTFCIQWKWPRITGLALAVFSVGWDTFLVFWYIAVQDSAPIAMKLFPIGHVAVGLVLPYVALAYLLNSTIIEVGGGELKVRHQPLPFPGRRALRAGDVRQLFCVERTSQKGAVTYDVMARLASDRELKLVSGLPGPREARFVEQRIESRLGLTNQPMDDELAS